MGTIAPELKELFPNTFRQTMYTRAGNVVRNDLVQIASKAIPMTCGCPERLYHGVLLPNGDMSLCCMDYGLKHIHGNLLTQSYDEIIPVDGTAFDFGMAGDNSVSFVATNGAPYTLTATQMTNAFSMRAVFDWTVHK